MEQGQHDDQRQIESWPRSVPPLEPFAAEQENVKILIVDDTPENLVAIEAVLCQLNQSLIKARSGEEALSCALHHEFAVILMDIHMPGLDGLETAGLIRQRPSCEHVPIIFISATSSAEIHTAKAYALGAVDYIFTPIIPEILKTKVAVFVELQKKREETRRQAERLREMDQREHRRRLVEASERIEFETKRNRFFNLSTDMLAIADFNGEFCQVNPAWTGVLGYTEDEMARRPLIGFVHPEERAATLARLSRLKRTQKRVHCENRWLSARGAYRYFAWTVTPFTTDRLLYVFARDITEQKLSENQIRTLNGTLKVRAAELEQANQELQREVAIRKLAELALKETNAELESFTYSVSHDLRAPLRAMQGFAEALADDCGAHLDATGREYTERIVSAAARMESLIQDLLTYSRVSYTELELQSVNLEQVIAQALHQLEVPLREANADIELQRPLLNVMAHHGTAVQIICNLISNAIKFVAPGTRPRVVLRLEQVNNFGRLWVEDNGIGIAPEFYARIFRVFERLHGVEKYPGTGIGLAIVRKGAERMGGRAGLESALGQGSRFWVELPLAGADEALCAHPDKVSRG